MARQIRSWNPGDAANAYVRMILSDIGRLVGGLSEAEWDGTLEFFGGRCAYTGRQLTIPRCCSRACRPHQQDALRRTCLRQRTSIEHGSQRKEGRGGIMWSSWKPS